MIFYLCMNDLNDHNESFSLCYLIRLMQCSMLLVTSISQPWSCLFLRGASSTYTENKFTQSHQQTEIITRQSGLLGMTGCHLTSAITPTQPAMTAALAWAPLMPPRPEVTKTRPLKSPDPRYLRPAFSTVSYTKNTKKPKNITSWRICLSSFRHSLVY